MITLSYISESIQINYPEWEGFLPIAHLAIEPIELQSGFDTWNNGIANDFRTLSIDRTLLTEDQAEDLDDFFHHHRGLTLDMAIGTDTDFFPFLPDKGDSGIFTIKIIDRKFGEFDQFKQFTKSIDILMVSAPEYELPAVTNQGNFQIGSVDGLLFPQIGIKPERDKGYKAGITYGGDLYKTDMRDDIHITSFTQRCNKGLAAELIDFLTSASGRDQDITIIAPDDFYLFDIRNSASGTYVCKLIQKEIQCRQLDYEEFEIPLKFWLKSIS